MRRIVLALAMTVGLAIGTVVPVSALDTSVTLSCSDGTSVKLVVDADTLASLTASVQAMLDYPAGLSCTIIQNPLGVTFGSVALASSEPFIVAGGRWQVSCSGLAGVPIPPGGAIDGGLVARVPGAWYSLRSASLRMEGFFWVNIAVNVHKKDGGYVGTLNETIPENQSCPDPIGPVGESHFTSKPTCLNFISPDTALVTSKVTQSSGQVQFPTPGSLDVTDPNNPIFTPGLPVAVNDILHFGLFDNGRPPGQNSTTATPPTTTDMLNGVPASPKGTEPETSCLTQWDPIYHLGAFDGSKQYGNISAHP